MSAAADLVLEWCSVVGRGSRQQFEIAVSGLIDDGSPSALLSGLEVAGHVEVDWERSGRWSVNPPVLALPEGSGGNACLVGGRNQGTRVEVENLLQRGLIDSFSIVPNGRGHASSWFIGCRSFGRLIDAAELIGATVAVAPARFLMDLFKDLDETLSASETEYVPSGFGAKKLNVQTMRYEAIDVKYARWPAGCFEQLSNGRRKYIFVDDGDRRHVCDRWVATHAEIRRQRRLGEPVPSALSWDQNTDRMAVLASAQLPTQWARAAVLCSGLAPRRVTEQRWYDVYEGVPPTMFGRFTKSLEIPPTSCDLSGFDLEAT